MDRPNYEKEWCATCKYVDYNSCCELRLWFYRNPVGSLSCSLSTAAPYLKPGKQSYLSIPGSVPLLGITVGNLVDRCASRFPDSPAIVVSTPNQVRKNYQELKKEVSYCGFAANVLNVTSSLYSVMLNKTFNFGRPFN